jgi:hypothetical protein
MSWFESLVGLSSKRKMDIRCLQVIINLYACKTIIKEANDVRPKYSTMRPPTPTKRSSKEPQICYCETGPMSDDRKSEAPHPQGGASGKCRYDYRVGFPPRPCLLAWRRGIKPTCPWKHLEELLRLNRVINAILILKDKLQYMGSYQSRTRVNKAIDEWCALARAMNHPEVIIRSIPEDWKESITRLKSLNAKLMATMIFDTFHWRLFKPLATNLEKTVEL